MATSHLPTGTVVEAQNPGGRMIRGTLVGHTADGWGRVEWSHRSQMHPHEVRTYVGTFHPLHIKEVAA